MIRWKFLLLLLLVKIKVLNIIGKSLNLTPLLYSCHDAPECHPEYLRPRLHYTVFIRRRYSNVPHWPTVYTVPFSYPVSNEDRYIRKYLSVYTMPFS